ncbi:Hypothetical predicted protein [Olea europaea subsp. europaea]|uniref:Uncharacterized protein n=1 Tax=Olea europaea subsp. europaea TaxID=158383 RepID=A0A8S0VNH8_OLEEU|nr:Hypothetical predicted protein [Olea europaea subsp. europaea]
MPGSPSTAIKSRSGVPKRKGKTHGDLGPRGPGIHDCCSARYYPYQQVRAQGLESDETDIVSRSSAVNQPRSVRVNWAYHVIFPMIYKASYHIASPLN